jgi:hypothetical protein
MAARTVFCSYARSDSAAVRAIAAELDQLGQQAWIDQKLSGGQSWWDTILCQIRACDCFLFALSDASMRSKACQAELDYAHRLGRIILPVAVAPVIDALLPPHLAEVQRIEAGDTRMLARALLGLPPSPPLPDPLPDPPPVPITYLNSLAAILDRDELTPADQRNLEGSLKQRLGNPEERDAAVALLKRLRQHPSVTAFVAGEIDADLAAVEPRPAASPAPEPERVAPPRAAPPPEPPVVDRQPSRQAHAPAPAPGDRPREGSPPTTGGRRGLLVAVALVVMLAVGGLAVWALASGDGDGDAPVDTTVVDPPATTGDDNSGGTGGGGSGGGTRTTRGGGSGGGTGTTEPPTTEPRPDGGGSIPPISRGTIGELEASRD